MANLHNKPAYIPTQNLWIIRKLQKKPMRMSVVIFLGQFREMFQIIFIAVSLVFNVHHKENHGKIIFSVFVYVSWWYYLEIFD